MFQNSGCSEPSEGREENINAFYVLFFLEILSEVLNIGEQLMTASF